MWYQWLSQNLYQLWNISQSCYTDSTTESFEVASVNSVSLDCDEDHTSNSDYASDNDDDDDCSAMLDGYDNHGQPCCSAQDVFKRSAAMALLGLKEKFKLTQTSLQVLYKV